MTTIDYDKDGDGLIEIKTLAQFAVIDPDGRGLQGQDDEDFDAAFPNPAERMGCVDDADNPSDCTGYELMTSLTLSGDWTPIATYRGTFEGNGNTISGLTINADEAGQFGLFAETTGTVRNVGLVGVDITVTATAASGMVDVGGLAGMNSGIVSNSYAMGQISVTRGDSGGTSNAGGLVGENSAGSITASYATVAVTATGGDPNAGGLVGNNTASIAASYATGDVSATGSENDDVDAGGLAGSSDGTIEASYATGDATATASGDGAANAGGLVGSGSVEITASYSTGAPTANADADDGTANAGGLKGSGSDDAVNSYWAADSSGIATTTAAGVPTSTVALQAPIGYGTSTNPADIFVDWNLDIGVTTTPQDPWDFGGSWQYPVLKYGALKDVQQRAQVTLVLSATSTSEGGKITLTATLDMPSKQDTKVMLTASSSDAVMLSADEATIPAGDTESDEVTITADNNTVLAENDEVTVSGQVSPGGSGADNPADVTISITDDEAEEPTVVEGVKVRTKETLAVVTWDALDGADGYTVQWTSRHSRGEAVWDRAGDQDASGTSTTVRRLRPGTDYTFRVSATNMDNSWSAGVAASTEGDEDDGASPFATMTMTPTPTPAVPPATPIPPTSMVSTSTAATLRSGDGTVTLEFPAGSRSDSYQVNFESETGCTYPGAKADVTFTCVSVLIFDSEDMLEMGVELDTPATLTFRLTAEQVEALGDEFLLAKLHEMGGLMILTRASAGAGWTAVSGTTLTFDDETGGATLTASVSNFSSFTAVADQATYDAVQEMYGHLLPRDTLTPPTGGPSLPGVALLALLLGSVALLTAGWVMTARRSGA